MARSPDDTRPYTVKQLAETWQCTEETIYALIRKFQKGEPDGLPAFTIGGKLLRIKAEVVDQWQNSGGSTKWGDTGSGRSSIPISNDMRPSSVGATTAGLTDIDLESSLRRRAELRSIHGLAGSKL